jgi:hypothetical protein
VNDAIDSATTTTGVFAFWGKSNAPPVSTTPHISAKIRPMRRVCRSSALCPVSGR